MHGLFLLEDQSLFFELLYFGLVKWLHLLISIIFLSFAIMQWNDPDALIWILMYIVVSVVAFLAFKGQHYLLFNAGVTAILVVSLIRYVPDLATWMEEGMPSITESMQADSPYVELVRESLGLLLSLVTMLFYLLLSQKKGEVDID